MLKSRFSIFVVLSGLFIFSAYLLYDYSTYGSGLLIHLLTVDMSIETFFHFVILGTLAGTMITGYLINERKTLHEKTQISEQKLKNAAHEWMVTFDSMPYGVMITDRDSRIIRANKYIADLYSLAFSEIISIKRCNELLCKNDTSPDSCPVLKAKYSDKTETHEYVDKEKNRIFIESITPMRNGNEENTSFVHVLIDITDSKSKEKKLIRSKNAFFNMLKDLDSTNRELKDIYRSLVVTLSNIIDAKSPWTNGHSTNVAKYATAIARKMNLNEHLIEDLNIASLLHDIGKIGTYDMTLDKPGKLSDSEFELIKRHPVIGEEILKPIKGLEAILPIIRSHHEKLDGSGYPDGLKGDEIPLIARIVSVADSYDAMTSDRPYRPSRGKEFAISELMRYSGTQFDSDVVDIFIRLITHENIDAHQSSFQKSLTK